MKVHFPKTASSGKASNTMPTPQMCISRARRSLLTRALNQQELPILSFEQLILFGKSGYEQTVSHRVTAPHDFIIFKNGCVGKID
jgi:hypothetical protein